MVCRVYSQAAIEYDKRNSQDSKQILLSDKDRKVLIVELCTGCEGCYLRLPC